MLKKIRITLGAIFFVCLTLLFLDFTGTLHAYLGWMAKVQLLSAILAHNVVIVAVLVVLTLIFGRIYCSVICPLGVMQDIFLKIGLRGKKNKLSYSKPKRVLRYSMLVVFLVSLIGGTGVIAHILAPYSAYGRIASSLLSPVYKWGNNLLADIAERSDSYAFYEVEVWTQVGATMLIAILTLGIVGILALRNGRTYCNTICPVGTVLGLIAKFSWLKPVIDTNKCKDCGKCAKNCKAACIDAKNHAIDYTRCVACMDCLENCSFKAISYCHPKKVGNKPTEEMSDNTLKTPDTPVSAPDTPVSAPDTPVSTNDTADTTNGSADMAKDTPDNGRRTFLVSTALFGVAAAVKAQEERTDGGLAVIEDRVPVHTEFPVIPAGSFSLNHLTQHCTACQLCVSACPQGILQPSTDLSRLMQPEMHYENGYCRPECTRCADVCPAGAIKPITRENKASTQIGHAVWVRKNCVPLTDGELCGNCARNCPAGAIEMVKADELPNLTDSEREAIAKTRGRRPRPKMVPAINTERCIGCGACEALCPARPFTAIYVEGHKVHKEI